MSSSSESTEQKLFDLYDTVAEGCIECGLCQKDCRFLQKYGSPKQIAEKRTQDPDGLRTSFECSLCWLCTAVCPKKIDPAAMFAAMRNQAQRAGHGNFDKHDTILRYERWGASSFISWYSLPDGCDTVFFPGCAMAGTRSERVLELYSHLKKTIPFLGIVLDCCTKPSHDLGRKDFFSKMFSSLRDALKDNGVKQVLVACPSCYRVWKDYGSPISVKSIYEELTDTGSINKIAKQMEITVHDPCPTRHDTAVHDAVRGLVKEMGFTLREMKHHGRKTICCGEGGAACYLVPDFAGNWTQTRAHEAEGTYMITYCAGCTNFLGRLVQVGHIADLFFEPERTIAGKERIAGSPMTWLKRLHLKRKLKKVVSPGVTGNRAKDGSVALSNEDKKDELSNTDRQTQLDRMYLESRRSFPDVEEITPEEALKLYEAGKAVLVDVRSAEEQKVSMIPGALTKEQFLGDANQAENKQVIVYCTIGYRSGKFIRSHEHEFPGMKNLRGGVLGWLHVGGKVADASGEVERVHVYGSKWALQPEKYIPVFKKS